MIQEDLGSLHNHFEEEMKQQKKKIHEHLVSPKKITDKTTTCYLT